jgi:hypothetical protein
MEHAYPLTASDVSSLSNDARVPRLRSSLRGLGSPLYAVGIASVLWPRVVEYRGCFLIEDLFEPEGADQWIATLEGRTREVESVINHVHLWDLFDVFADGVDNSDRLLQFARFMVTMWQQAAEAQHPSKRFDASLTNNEDEYGPVVTLACVR